MLSLKFPFRRLLPLNKTLLTSVLAFHFNHSHFITHLAGLPFFDLHMGLQIVSRLLCVLGYISDLNLHALGQVLGIAHAVHKHVHAKVALNL